MKYILIITLLLTFRGVSAQKDSIAYETVCYFPNTLEKLGRLEYEGKMYTVYGFVYPNGRGVYRYICLKKGIKMVLSIDQLKEVKWRKVKWN